ncbi:DNA circularization protein [Pantoea stewartii]|uniref:DNA circularization protein n=1 Tax=Pantoea stewartii TaxID=66269 RepID=UPI003366A8D1
MAWSDSLQDASFRGVRFDVKNMRDSVERALGVSEYPYKDGADLEDLGAQPRSLQLQAVFWGDDYESRLQTFLEALNKRGSAELVHPVFGSMPNMQVKLYQVNHNEDDPDYCTIDIQFLQHSTGNPFFARDWPLGQADSIFNSIQGMLDSSSNLMESALSPLRTGRRYMSRVKALGVAALNMVSVLRGEVTGFTSSTTDFVNFPSAFMNDILSSLSLGSSHASTSASDNATVYTSTPAVAISDWSAIRSQAGSVATMPDDLITGKVSGPVAMPANITPDDIRELRVMVITSVAIELSQQASDYLSDETLTAVLTPDDIETIINDTRQAIQNAIDANRNAYAPEMSSVSSAGTKVALDYQPVVDALRDIGLSLQVMATALIQARPPLTRRKVTSAGNLHLIAHLWYGDYTRASELMLLNPLLRDPNNLSAGELLYAYSE